MKAAITSLVIVLALGCATLFTGVVTLTTIRDSAMKELAALNAKGLIDAQTDAKITAADAAFRQAAGVAEASLISYKSGGSEQEYVNAIQAVRVAVFAVLDILYPLQPVQSGELRAKANKARTLK